MTAGEFGTLIFRILGIFILLLLSPMIFLALIKSASFFEYQTQYTVFPLLAASILILIFSKKLGNSILTGRDNAKTLITIDFFSAGRVSVIFVGMYFFMQTLSYIIHNVNFSGTNSQLSAPIIQNIIVFCIALFLILRSHIIAKWIIKLRSIGKTKP